MGNSEPLKILAVDSSSLTGSVALCEGERLVAESVLNVRSTHSENLLKQIDLLLADVGWALSDLDLLAAVVGPGSFTGLRIGIATVKSLAQVIAKPVVGVSSLEMLAMNLPLVREPICVFMDARKKEVYSQLFEWSEDGPVAIDEGKVVPPAELLKGLEGSYIFVGDGTLVYRQEIVDTLGDRAIIPPESVHQPRASQAAWLAGRAFSNGGQVRAAELLPIYIRPSDAELGRQKKTNPV